MSTLSRTYKVIWPGNTTGVLVNTDPSLPTILYGWFLSNVANTPRFVKFYNKATPPITGTDVPKLTLLIPAQGTANLGAAANLLSAQGISFQLGLGVAVTAGAADNDTTAPTASDVIVNLLYA